MFSVIRNRPHEQSAFAQRDGDCDGLRLPTAYRYNEYSVWLPIVDGRLQFGPSKQWLAQVSGRRIRPIDSPCGVKQCTRSVPGPAQPALDYAIQSQCVRIPSANPGDISASASALRSFWPTTTPNTRM